MSELPYPSPPLEPLEQLGIYRVESLLGQGGMGEVYLAWDELLQRRVAIKRVRTDRLGDETQRVRFLLGWPDTAPATNGCLSSASRRSVCAVSREK